MAPRSIFIPLFPEIEANAKSIAAALVDFADRFREVAHIDDAIVDIYLKPDDVAGFEAVLLDLNPLIVRSDPCLFQWRNGGILTGAAVPGRE